MKALSFWKQFWHAGAALAERTAELAKANEALQAETYERRRAEESLRESEKRFQGSNTGISERMEAEASLRESKKRLHHLVTSNPAVIFALKVVDGGVEESWISDNHRRFTGYDERERTSRAWWLDHVHPDDRERVIASESATSPDDRSITEYRFRRKDGTYFWIRDEKVLVRDSAGKPLELVGSLVNITDLKQTQENLQRQQTELRVLFDYIPAMVMIKDADNRILRVNKRIADSVGKTIEEIEGKPCREIYPLDADKYYADDLEVIRSGTPKLGIVESFRDKDGKEIWIRTNKVPYCDKDGKVIGVVVLAEDVSDQRRADEAMRLLETRLFQSQKLETVGKLAGGIAHEFNSIMTAIIGQSALLLADLPEGDALRHNATEIRNAADRAATLTRQLLAYGRKQILRPEILDLNSVLAGMENVLRHLSGRTVNLRIILSDGLQSVKVDAGQIEQVIMNVAMNAIDAMPNGGKLTLETAAATLDQEYVSHVPELKAGEYAMLAITDTGAGMSEEVEARIFEPFFSTKGAGRGTGLGLATTYGILKQSGGHINVYSEPGRGATFKIYLPYAGAPDEQPARPPEAPAMPGGRETILLVEDDPALREMACALLKRLGYTVWTAADGIEALNLAHLKGRGHIDLLFTDVVMPHMSGKELSDRIRSCSPGTAVLFTSAYTEHSIVHQGVLDDGVALLQKPFTPVALALKIREMLDREISKGVHGPP